MITVKQQQLKALSSIRKRRRENKVRKKMRIKRSCRVRVKYHRPRTGTHYQHLPPLETTFNVPVDFSVTSNVDGVMTFINYVYQTIQRVSGAQVATFDLSAVKHIDNMAISILLALVNSISRKKCFVKGDSPVNRTARETFINSGFFEHVELIQGKRPNRKNDNNLMIEAGTDQTKNHVVGSEIRKAMKYLTGKASPYRPAYSVIQEICCNSVEHANKETINKNWLISVFYENNKIVFTMVDIGKGILGTLKKKMSQKFRDFVKFKDEVDMLYGAFTKQYQSATWDINRNKGLPKIQDYHESGFISNLKVVTNNVVLNFDGIGSHVIRANFKGTFYTWTISKENIIKWNNRIK